MIQPRQATATRESPVLRRQSALTVTGPLIQFRPSSSLNESTVPEVCNLAFKSGVRSHEVRGIGRSTGGSAELRLQFNYIGENVGLATQLVGDHWWVTGNSGNHCDA